MIALQYYIAITTASPLVTTSNAQAGDPADGDSEDQTRIVAVEFKDPRGPSYERPVFRQIGDWTSSGPAEGVALYQNQEG